MPLPDRTMPTTPCPDPLGIESARSQFRRVTGYRQLLQLAASLKAATIEEPGFLDLQVTASCHNEKPETATQIPRRTGHLPFCTRQTSLLT